MLPNTNTSPLTSHVSLLDYQLAVGIVYHLLLLTVENRVAGHEFSGSGQGKGPLKGNATPLPPDCLRYLQGLDTCSTGGKPTLAINDASSA